MLCYADAARRFTAMRLMLHMLLISMRYAAVDILIAITPCRFSPLFAQRARACADADAIIVSLISPLPP